MYAWTVAMVSLLYPVKMFTTTANHHPHQSSLTTARLYSMANGQLVCLHQKTAFSENVTVTLTVK